MFVPQALPLYAIVEGDSQVYMVIGWKASDTRWWPYLILTGALSDALPPWMFGAINTDTTRRFAFYTTRAQAEAALLAQ